LIFSLQRRTRRSKSDLFNPTASLPSSSPPPIDSTLSIAEWSVSVHNSLASILVIFLLFRLFYSSSIDIRIINADVKTLLADPQLQTFQRSDRIDPANNCCTSKAIIAVFIAGIHVSARGQTS
jgi:hypothetical protein